MIGFVLVGLTFRISTFAISDKYSSLETAAETNFNALSGTTNDGIFLFMVKWFSLTRYFKSLKRKYKLFRIYFQTLRKKV